MRKLEITFVAVFTALSIVVAAGAPYVAWAAHEQDASPRKNHDRHAGYYYPLPQTRETYTSQAITSRETREYFIPSVPMEIPSEIVMVL